MKHEIVKHTQKDYTMSLYPCIECGNEVRPRTQALQCDDCGFWQHRICGTGIDQATYRLAAIRGRMDWLCVACSLAASNPSDQVPVAESTRTDMAQGKFKSLVWLWHTAMITPFTGMSSCLWRYLTCPTKKFQRVSSG